MSLGERTNLSERIREVVRRRIVDGTLAPNSRINEVRLAGELGVSRTPLREALTALVPEGALTSVPRRGFFVKPLSAAEFLHLYPIRRLLDPEALRLSGLPTATSLRRLEVLNAQLGVEHDAGRRVRLDDAWHLELVASCPNPVLLDLIRQFMARTRRYELAFYREETSVGITSTDHERVVAAAKAGDLEAAIVALESNLTSAIEPMLAWLRKRGSGDEEAAA